MPFCSALDLDLRCFGLHLNSAMACRCVRTRQEIIPWDLLGAGVKVQTTAGENTPMAVGIPQRLERG